MSASAELSHLRQSLSDLRNGTLTVVTFVRDLPPTQALFEALPARYAEVWHGLIDRLQSGALFSEESCSFSQTDLIDSLALWLDKAEHALATHP
jgi:hypothetical protein